MTENKDQQNHSNLNFPSKQSLISNSNISTSKNHHSNLEMSNPSMPSNVMTNDDISFVGRESPSTYLETLYRRQREMEVHRPRKLKAGQTLNVDDKQWEKE